MPPKETSIPGIKRRKKIAMPIDVEPMLATLVSKPSTEGHWVFEVKWDGFRAIAYKNNGEVELKSRNLKSFNDKFYPLHKAVASLPVDAVIDDNLKPY
jgi:bifunctional non-homologous end joining protein LigD